MDNEWKEVMRMTNILCRKVFDFCKREESPKRKEMASVISQRISKIIDLFDNPEFK